MSKLARTVILLCLILGTAAAFAGTTYYIDYSSGSDSNNGTSKSTPWKRAPGMKGCTSNCSSTTINPGDQIVLKGGVTWDSATQGWWFQGNGTSGNVVTVGGLDLAWFDVVNCAAAGYPGFCRPVINAGGVAVTIPGVGRKNLQLFLDCHFCRVSNIEFKGMNLTADLSAGYCDAISWCLNSAAHDFEFDQNYCHGWTHNGGLSGNLSSCANGDTGSPSNNSNSTFHDNVCDGSDTTKDTGECLHGGPDVVYGNYCAWAVSCFVGEYLNIHDNYIAHIISSYGGAHENGIEINFAAADSYIYNNVITDVQTGLALWCAPEVGTTCNIYNNLIYKLNTNNIVDLAGALTNPSGSVVMENNTVECGPDTGPSFTCVGGIDPTIQNVALRNNHFITSGSVWSRRGSTPVTESNNIVQTLATANGQGYSSSQTVPFSPTSSSNSTVGAGASLTNSCSGNASALCKDTTLGVGYDGTLHQVIVPNRATSSRSASSAWDVGAYLLGSVTTVRPPQPPTGLMAVVH
jgi:hypothetical protein